MQNMSEQDRLFLILIKWMGTVLCLFGIALTSFNVYPANIFLSFIGSGMWTLAGLMQRDIPLLLVEAVAVVLYGIGIITWFIIGLTKWGIL
jgi:hypothetical protein